MLSESDHLELLSLVKYGDREAPFDTPPKDGGYSDVMMNSGSQSGFPVRPE